MSCVINCLYLIVCIVSVVWSSAETALSPIIDKPFITSVDQLNEKIIRLKWATTIPFRHHIFRRYLIQYSSDDFTSDIHEWPAQLSRISVDTNSVIFNISTTRTNIECFNECLKHLSCFTVTSTPEKTDNCHLKSIFSQEVSSPDVNEVYKLNEYTNETKLFNLPYEKKYKFRVSLYDQNMNVWTPFSEPSDREINMKINLQITVERVGYSSLKVKWKQLGPFNKYMISRYLVKISMNEEPFREKFVLSDIVTTNLEPNYFEVPLSESIGVFLTERDCFSKCVNVMDCVQYVFYKNNGSCHLMSRYDPARGIKDHGVISRFIKSNSNEILLENLKLFSNYKIKVNYVTPYGTNGSSNLVSYVLTNLKPILRIVTETNDFSVTLSWNIAEPVRLRTYQIYFSINESNYFNEYFESNLIDFIDPNSYTFSASLNDCFNKCVSNVSCLAFSWKKAGKLCSFKSNKNITKVCDIDSFCSSILDYSSEIKINNHFVNTKYCYMISVLSDFGYIGEKSNQACFKWEVSITNKLEKESVTENESTSFKCHLNGIGPKQVESFRWYRNDEEITQKKSKNIIVSLKEMRLKLNGLAHVHDDGLYHCGVTLINGQVLFSNKISVRVKYGPKIEFNIDNSKPLVVNESSEATIACKAEGYPVPDVKLKFNGHLLVNVESLLEDNVKWISIFIKNVTRKYNGTFTCYVNDDNKQNLDLLVISGPKVLSELKELTVNEFESAKFTCSIEKFPPPNIVWKNVDTNQVINFIHYTQINSITYGLLLEKVTRNSTGTYSCYDEDYPHLDVKFKLFVKFAPHLEEERKLTRIDVIEHQRLNMNCTAVGFPVPIIEWKCTQTDQKVVSNYTISYSDNATSFLIIDDVLKHDACTYACSIQGHPEQNRLFNIMIQSKPNRPSIIEAESLLNERIRFVWSVDDTGNLPITHVILEWSTNITNVSSIQNHTIQLDKSMNDPTKHMELTVNISLSDESYVRLMVKNRLGLSEPSAAFRVQKKEISIKIRASSITIAIIVILTIAALSLILTTILFTIKLNQYWRNERRFEQESRCKLNVSIDTNKNLQLLSQINGSGVKKLTESFSMSNLESRVSLAKSLNSLEISSSSSGKNKCRRFSLSSRASPSLASRLNARSKAAACHIYDRDSLLKRFTDDFTTLDRDMHYEFCEIKNPDNKTFNDSLKMQNERKSRYKHVYPYDDNRVQLSIIPGRPDSDFINASYIEGYKSPKKFIAAQGPTKETAFDFLRMIFEKDIRLVVMLTQVYEGEPPMLKSWPYWNDHSMIRIGPISCEVKSVQNRIFYEIRKLEIKHYETRKIVDHFFYKEWPDKSSPTESQSIIDLICNIDKDYSSDESPILVHCSAGVGRTGTFIAIYNLMDSMNDQQTINPYQLVTDMRKQRAYLVQNWEQYKFIHQTLLEWCLFGNTSIDVQNREYIKWLLTEKTKINTEFENVIVLKDKFKLKTYTYDQSIRKDLSVYDMHEQILTVEKNLSDMKILLKDVLHIKISSVKCDFLLTNEPNARTINDFLTFIIKIKPVTIVSLSPLESFYLHELSTGSLTTSTVMCGISVSCKEVTTASNEYFKVYDIQFTDTKNNNSKFGTRYYTTSQFWSTNNGDDEIDGNDENGIPNCDKTVYIEFINTILKHLNNKINRPNQAKLINNYIILQAKDFKSYEKCGIFVCLYYLLFTICNKSQFDVVHIVRLLRRNFYKFINKSEHYTYLYEVCGCEHILEMIKKQSQTLNNNSKQSLND